MAKRENFIFGIHAIQEALRAGKDLDKVLVRRGSPSDLLKSLLSELSKSEVAVQQVPVEKAFASLAEIVDTFEALVL